jgi:hypothetical protein
MSDLIGCHSVSALKDGYHMSKHFPSLKPPAQPCTFEGDLGSTVLNALSAHIAILDEQGVILETNRAWQAFAA